MRSKAIFAIFVGLGVLAYAGVQDGVLLRKELKEGAKETYGVTIQGNQTVEVMGSPMEMTFKGGYDWIFDFKKIDAEKNLADVDITVKDMKFEMEGGMAGSAPAPEFPKEVKSAAKLDNRYRMTETKVSGNNAAMMMAMGAGSSMSPFIELPEKAVKVGDTWTVIAPKNPFTGDTDSKLTATFKGDGKIGEVSGNQVELSGPIALNVDLAKMFEEIAKSGSDPTGGMAMKGTMTGTMTVKLTAILDKASGKALAMTMSIGTDATMNMTEPMAMAIPMKGTTSMKYALK